MGLKHFHVVFITAAIILCLGTAYWCLFTERSEGAMLYSFFGICLVIISAGLIGYEYQFILKTKNLSDN